MALHRVLSTGITEDNRQNGSNVATSSGDSDVQRETQMSSIIERLIEQIVKHRENVRKEVQVTILPTIYEQLLRMKVFLALKFFCTTILAEILLKNVDQIYLQQQC